MKKTLLAAALLAGFAGAASAQSSVTLFGVVDGGISYQNIKFSNGASQSTAGLSGGMRAGNRWGLRGVEDIGNGNQIMFHLEAGFDVRDGAQAPGGQFGRQTELGVQNKAWGKVSFGRLINLSSAWQPNFNGIGAGYGILSMGNTFGATGTVRMNNTVIYLSPNMNGFQAGLGYSFATGMSSNGATATGANNYAAGNNLRALTLGGRYNNGPVAVAATYEKLYAASGTAQSGKSISSMILGGSYDLKVAKLSLAYGQTRDGFFAGSSGTRTGAGNTVGGSNLNTNAGGNINAAFFSQGAGIDSYTIGGVIPVNKVSKVLLTWGMAKPTGTLASTRKSQNTLGLAYEYSLSKRSIIYAFGGQTNNAGTQSKVSNTIVGLGLTHSF